MTREKKELLKHWKLLKEDGEIRNFYNSHFHIMKDEYNAKAEQYLAEKHLQEQGV